MTPQTRITQSTDQDNPKDNYIRIENIESQRSLKLVKNQNEKSLTTGALN